MSVHRLCWVVVAASTIAVSLVILFAIRLWHLTSSQVSDTGNHLKSPWKAAESMSAEEIYRYLHWTNTTACLLAVDFGFWVDISRGLWAADAHNGRKVVCLDQTIAPVYNNCLVYSFGVGHQQWTFEEDMAKFGCHVYSFDPSTGVVGEQHNRSRNIHFYNLGLGDETTEDGRNLKSAWTIYEMLEDRHGPTTPIDVLKIDIDDLSEWVAIRQLLLSGFLVENVKQLVVGIHLKANDSLETYRQRARILQDLESPLVTPEESSGRFVRFSSRPNPTTKRPVAILDGKEEYIGWEMAWYNLRYVLSRKLVDYNNKHH